VRHRECGILYTIHTYAKIGVPNIAQHPPAFPASGLVRHRCIFLLFANPQASLHLPPSNFNFIISLLTFFYHSTLMSPSISHIEKASPRNMSNENISTHHDHNLARTATISTELFEKLYLSPKVSVQGQLRQTFANPTPL